SAHKSRNDMPAGSQLTIETRNITIEPACQPVSAAVPPGTYVTLDVSDKGCGMDARTRAHIFEPFFTTKSDGRGAGLGLSMVYGIVKQSGGAIRVDSEAGGGSTFTIYLGRVDDPIALVE